MNVSTIRKLTQVEWDFASLDAAMADLATILHQCAAESPCCADAALGLKSIRKRLQGVWRHVEPDVTEAQRASETIEAPF